MSVLAPEHGLDVPLRVEYPDDLDAALHRALEDQAVRESGDAQHAHVRERRVVVVPRRSHLGHGCQVFEGGLGGVKEAEGEFVAPALLGDLYGDVGEVQYRLRALVNAISWHTAPPLLQSLGDVGA